MNTENSDFPTTVYVICQNKIDNHSQTKSLFPDIDKLFEKQKQNNVILAQARTKEGSQTRFSIMQNDLSKIKEKLKHSLSKEAE